MEIRKINNRVWKFIDSEVGEFSPSKFTINELNNEITIVYFNNLRSKTYYVTEVELYDIGALSPFTTNSGIALMVELEALNCPCFQKDETNIYGSGSVNWGDINGTLSNQTDLQNALDFKEEVINKATDFTTINETLYPSVKLVNDTFVKKSFAQSFDFTGTGANQVIPLDPLGREEISLTGSGLTSISGFDLSLITGNPSAEVPYFGKTFRIRNLTGHDVELQHANYLIAEVSLLFINEANIILPHGHWIEFQYRSMMTEGARSWSDTQKYKTISTDIVLDNTYNGAIIWITTSANITISNTLTSGFNCTFKTFTGVTATFLTSGGATINASESDGAIQSEKTMSFLANYTGIDYILSGGGLS